MKIHNGIAIIERDTHLSKWVVEHNRLDFDINALPTYLPYFPKNGTLINIGANIGCYAYAFKDIASKIICFEPNEEAFECLEYNLAKYPNVELHKIAISDKISNCTINNDSDNVGMAYIEENNGCAPFLISVRYLDFYELDSCDFILMDCEGFELKALIGAKETINKFRPIMVIEINDATLSRQGISRNDIFAWLQENNYIYRNIYENQGLNDSQLDIICTPK